MERFVLQKKDEKGNVIESTIPLPADYIDALVPPFPIENNTVLEPYVEKEEKEQNY